MDNGLEVNDYPEILKQLVSEIKSARVVLSKRVTTTLNELFWNIGKYITKRKLVEGYGKAVVSKAVLNEKMNDNKKQLKGLRYA